jgi:hypothetical protein
LKLEAGLTRQAGWPGAGAAVLPRYGITLPNIRLTTL